MTSDKGVQAVLSLLQTASSQKLEGLLRTLMIVVSVPEFAEKVSAPARTFSSSI